MKVETGRDVAVADALLPLIAAVEKKDDPGGDSVLRHALAGALDATNPGWRERPEFLARVREVGAAAAAEGLLKAHGLVTE